MPRGGHRPGAGRPRKPDAPEPPAVAVVEPVKPAAPARRLPAETTLPEAIAQAKDLTLRLLSELDAITTYAGELEDLIVAETAGDRTAFRRDAMLRAIALPSRTQTLKGLLAATRAWAELERPAVSEKPGKKEQRAEAAKEASVGRFAPPLPPRTIQ